MELLFDGRFHVGLWPLGRLGWLRWRHVNYDDYV
jgi:hypothetical protein